MSRLRISPVMLRAAAIMLIMCTVPGVAVAQSSNGDGASDASEGLSPEELGELFKSVTSVESAEELKADTIREYLPDWRLYKVRMTAGGATIKARMLVDVADGEIVRLKTSGSLPDPVLRKAVLKRDVEIDGKASAREFAELIQAIANPGEIKEVKQVDATTWHAYEDEFFEHRSGFVFELSEDGIVEHYTFDLKLVKKEE